ncbi:MAG: molybdopterin-dependent oxidoreductase [Streptosporangiales bacterium]|nr:molybdopterin-dependent oxidoreductase [Streptosporangiales bacterium]
MTSTSPRYVGSDVARREDRRFLTGQGRFVADLAGDRTLHTMFVRSTVARGAIRGIDVADADALPGVRAVFTATDLLPHLGPLRPLHQAHPAFRAAFHTEGDPRPLDCLAPGRVRYVGEPVAVVVAESRAVAEDAADLVHVDYEAAEPILDPVAAAAPGAALVHPDTPSNVAMRLSTSYGDVDGAFTAAHTVVDETFTMGRHTGMPLECRGVLATWDPRRERVEVWTSTQVPHIVRDALCESTGWSLGEVRVRVPDVGGGFGPKANVYPEEVVVPYLARMLGTSVAWLEDRAEHFTATAHSRDQRIRIRLAVDGEGRLRGLDVDAVADIGAGSLWATGIVANTAIHAMGPYRLPAYRAHGVAVYTNKTVVAQYRGAGRPEACFALERALDLAADRLGIGRDEIRRRNLLRADELPHTKPLPYRDGAPITYDGGDYVACLDACLKELPPEERDHYASDGEDLHVGHGVATYIEATGRGPYESARVRLLDDGDFEVGTGAASAGQSHETTLAQIAADALGVGLDRVRLVPTDTADIPRGVGTFASRSAVVAGNAVHAVGRRLAERAASLAARLLSVDEVERTDDGFAATDGRAVSWRELAGELGTGGRLDSVGALDERGEFSPPTVTWTMGAHAVLVGVDRETGLVRVLRYAVAHEGGVEVNPGVVEGQVRGGVAQGLGGALLEQVDYAEDGQPRVATFADYLLPASTDVPPVDVIALHAPTRLNALGLRGVGESGTIAAYAAVASALEDALPDRGAAVTSTPLTPAAVLGLLDDSAAPAPLGDGR